MKGQTIDKNMKSETSKPQEKAFQKLFINQTQDEYEESKVLESQIAQLSKTKKLQNQKLNQWHIIPQKTLNDSSKYQQKLQKAQTAIPSGRGQDQGRSEYDESLYDEEFSLTESALNEECWSESDYLTGYYQMFRLQTVIENCADSLIQDHEIFTRDIFEDTGRLRYIVIESNKLAMELCVDNGKVDMELYAFYARDYRFLEHYLYMEYPYQEEEDQSFEEEVERYGNMTEEEFEVEFQSLLTEDALECIVQLAEMKDLMLSLEEEDQIMGNISQVLRPRKHKSDGGPLEGMFSEFKNFENMDKFSKEGPEKHTVSIRRDKEVDSRKEKGQNPVQDKTKQNLSQHKQVFTLPSIDIVPQQPPSSFVTAIQSLKPSISYEQFMANVQKQRQEKERKEEEMRKNKKSQFDEILGRKTTEKSTQYLKPFLGDFPVKSDNQSESASSRTISNPSQGLANNNLQISSVVSANNLASNNRPNQIEFLPSINQQNSDKTKPQEFSFSRDLKNKSIQNSSTTQFTVQNTQQKIINPPKTQSQSVSPVSMTNLNQNPTVNNQQNPLTIIPQPNNVQAKVGMGHSATGIVNSNIPNPFSSQRNQNPQNFSNSQISNPFAARQQPNQSIAMPLPNSQPIQPNLLNKPSGFQATSNSFVPSNPLLPVPIPLNSSPNPFSRQADGNIPTFGTIPSTNPLIPNQTQSRPQGQGLLARQPNGVNKFQQSQGNNPFVKLNGNASTGLFNRAAYQQQQNGNVNSQIGGLQNMANQQVPQQIQNFQNQSIQQGVQNVQPVQMGMNPLQTGTFVQKNITVAVQSMSIPQSNVSQVTLSQPSQFSAPTTSAALKSSMIAQKPVDRCQEHKLTTIPPQIQQLTINQFIESHLIKEYQETIMKFIEELFLVDYWNVIRMDETLARELKYWYEKIRHDWERKFEEKEVDGGISRKEINGNVGKKGKMKDKRDRKTLLDLNRRINGQEKSSASAFGTMIAVSQQVTRIFQPLNHQPIQTEYESTTIPFSINLMPLNRHIRSITSTQISPNPQKYHDESILADFSLTESLQSTIEQRLDKILMGLDEIPEESQKQYEKSDIFFTIEEELQAITKSMNVLEKTLTSEFGQIETDPQTGKSPNAKSFDYFKQLCCSLSLIQTQLQSMSQTIMIMKHKGCHHDAKSVLQN